MHNQRGGVSQFGALGPPGPPRRRRQTRRHRRQDKRIGPRHDLQTHGARHPNDELAVESMVMIKEANSTGSSQLRMMKIRKERMMKRKKEMALT
mmetsp:Transcript_50006/g.106371  ORF Transcript_50006/g.106371 Transcript_50006/m.106371 type:complete len:94 (+) Transcript_50006:162-443(+)